MAEIIQINKEHLDVLLELEKLCFPNDHLTEEELLEQMNDERTSFLAIIDNDEVVAQVSIYNWKGQKDFVKIMGLGVHPEYRKKGYGHKLMDYVIESMKKDGMYIFKAETRASNKAMQKIFSNFSFELAYEMEDYYDKPKETAYRYHLICNQ